MPDNLTSLTFRTVMPAATGSFGQLARLIGEAGAQVGAVDIVRSGRTDVTRDVQVRVRDAAHAGEVIAAIEGLPGFSVEDTASRVLEEHQGGAIAMRNRMPLTSRDDLSMAYTPGVARVCMAIHHDFEQAWNYTIKANSVMVVSDGSDVVGMGDLGVDASLPACESVCLFLRDLAGVDAFPLPVDTRDIAEIVNTVALTSSVFAGIHLTDIAAPRCFEIAEALDARLEIPVLHVDRHGSAVAVLAALRNGLAVAGKDLAAATVAVTGRATAGGTATARLLEAAGVGAFTEDPSGADALVAWDGPVNGGTVSGMAAGAVVLSMAGASAGAMDAAVYGSNLPTSPNQVSAALAFPGIWRGAIDVRATTITDAMLLAAADALAQAARDADNAVHAQGIVPSVLAGGLTARIAAAVSAAAESSGVARRARA
ncbi:MAG: NAD-dependent malic enzyme [Thermoleophilia bacterium]|nr:NAD-dependent malic enzyme [Thermoleophilia bacterium]